MRVITRRTLTQFVDSQRGKKDYAALKAALETWFHEASHATWKSSTDVKQRYAHASIINAERIVFNVKGNDYRLIVSVDFRRSAIWIKWIGTHREYDKIDAVTVEHD